MIDCKNCNNTLLSTSDFCNSCGAKVIRNRLTIRNLFEHFSEHFLNYDNKFLQTFRHLFTKPEEVIGCYINGTRKKYVNVISYFAIALTLSGFQIFILSKFFPELMNYDFMVQEGMEEIQKKNFDFTQEYQSVLYMLMVPLYALISKTIFFDRKENNYTEHLVINMYASAHVSIFSTILIFASAFFGFNFGIVGLLVIPLQILFFAYCFKRFYNLSFGQIILKTIFFLLILFILFILMSILFAIIMYLNGDMEEMNKAKKAAIEAKEAVKDSIGN